MRDYWLAIDYRNGRPPVIGAEIASAEETYEALLDGRGVCLLASGNVSLVERGGIVTRPVNGISTSQFALAWRKDRDHPLVRAYVECARQSITGIVGNIWAARRGLFFVATSTSTAIQIDQSAVVPHSSRAGCSNNTNCDPMIAGPVIDLSSEVRVPTERERGRIVLVRPSPTTIGPTRRRPASAASRRVPRAGSPISRCLRGWCSRNRHSGGQTGWCDR